MKLTHILCPVDFSDASKHALEQATAIAGWYDARITALHVYMPVLEVAPLLPHTPPRSGSAGAEREAPEVQSLLETTRSFTASAANAGIKVDAQVDIGHPASQILARAANPDVDLLVMGTHGTSGFQHLMLGSITEKVLRRAPCPVLTVPPRAHAPSRLPFEHILCPIDFSDSSLSALVYAWSLAQEAEAGVTLLHVIEWPWPEPPSPHMEDLPPNEAARLAEFRRSLESTGLARLEALIPASVRDWCQPKTMVRHGKAYREVLAEAAASRADLVVMGVHGRHVVDLALFGSTTNQVVRAAGCPVLTVRAKG